MKSINKKILLVNILLGAFFTVAALSALMYVKNTKTAEVFERNRVSMQSQLNELIEKKYDVGLTNAVSFSANPDIVNALRTSGRDAAAEYLKQISELYGKNTNYKGIQIHIHDREGKSFIRSWDTSKFGDDLTAFRDSIRGTVNDKKSRILFEIGNIGLMIRSIAPVISGGEYLGSIEFMQGVGSVSRDLEKKGVVYALLIPSGAAKKYPKLAKNTAIGDFVLANNKWFSGEVVDAMTDAQLGSLTSSGGYMGKKFYFTSIPVSTDSGEPVGYHILGMPKEIVLSEVRHMLKLPYMLIGLLLLTIAASVIFSYFFTKSMIINKIRNIQSKLSIISKGDFTAKIAVNGTDELADLGKAVNIMSRDIGCSLFSVNNRIENLTELSAKLSTLAERLSSGALQQKETSTSAASAIEEVNTTVQEVASNAAHVAQAAISAEKQVTEGYSFSVSAKNNMAVISANVKQSSESVAKLGGLSQEIGQIVQVINDIADQTNLLALNAAIEAARAGDHGRGFAVVADEVRKLAEKTTTATKDISDMIETIRKETDNAVSNMNLSAKKVEEGMHTSEKTQTALENILSSVKTVTQEVEKIAQATDEEAKAMELLNHSVVEIDSIAKENQDIAHDTADMISELNQANRDIAESISAFRYDSNCAIG